MVQPEEAQRDEVKALLALGILASVIVYFQLRTYNVFVFPEASTHGYVTNFLYSLELVLVFYGGYLALVTAKYAVDSLVKFPPFAVLELYVGKMANLFFVLGSPCVLAAAIFALLRLNEVHAFGI